MDDNAAAPSGVDGVLAESTALSDIATNGALLNQVISKLTETVEGLGNIVLPVTNGGTGLNTIATGDLLYGSGPNALSALSDVATGNALISGGVGVAPSWGKVGLATHVSGTRPVANGGTGRASLTAYGILTGGTTATGAAQSVATGTAGQLLVSGGTSAVPSFVTLKEDLSGFVPYPEDGDVTVRLDGGYAYTVVSVSAQMAAGSLTLTPKKNTTAITGTSGSVTTTLSQRTATAGNAFAAADTLVLTISSTSGTAEGLSFTIKTTRAIS